VRQNVLFLRDRFSPRLPALTCRGRGAVPSRHNASYLNIGLSLDYARHSTASMASTCCGRGFYGLLAHLFWRGKRLSSWANWPLYHLHCAAAPAAFDGLPPVADGRCIGRLRRLHAVAVDLRIYWLSNAAIAYNGAQTMGSDLLPLPCSEGVTPVRGALMASFCKLTFYPLCFGALWFV